MGMFEKLKDWLMPPEIEEEYEEEEEEKAAQKPAKKVEAKTARIREEAVEAVAVNASPSNSVASRSRFTTTSVRDFNVEQSASAGNLSNFTYKNKKTNAPSLNVEVYAPKNFDQVRSIGDQLKRKNAVVVNYEMLGIPDQRRICDFLNGLIYVLDGDVKRISNNIVLYVPEGVTVSEAMTIAG
ncbi:MAG: cell division protein SepF [Selenomonadaceae bacterium]|nr:cell division protein SepF [Selenomonadaceae bacterium]